jgi:PHD/YefM family antitoxin component YafN of YafNO toxin-antitoxin module|tara:strand:+ start:1169 stop:1480 length:312 start_codon:yes stop_codon:yes gene_type:complete
MKTLDVPFKSISDVKKSPMTIFKEAEERNNGVYIFNRDKVAGVVLTQEQYENMNNEIEALYDRIDELIVKERLKDTNVKTYSVEEATGINLDNIELDENDGWE